MTLVAVLACSGAVFSASAAEAETRSGDVSITIPSRIVLDGSTFPVSVTSSALYSSLDKVWANLYLNDSLQTLEDVAPNTVVDLSSRGIDPGQIIAKADLPRTDCDFSSTDSCHWNSDYTWYYEFVHGLTFQDSAPATAKYGSKVNLSASSDGSSITWKATARRYGGYDWEPWSGAAISIGSTPVRTDADGVATWVERTSTLHTLTATAAESETVWGSASSPVAPSAPKPVKKPSPAPKAGHVKASASATKAAAALKKRVPAARKVVTLTKRNDANHLLGRKNGYTSAAVLYDKRVSCSDGPGVDCGATIEKFSSTAKAKARAKHIQKLLKRYSFLGTEYDTVHGHFLLRVTGDLSRSQAAVYKKAYLRSF